MIDPTAITAETLLQAAPHANWRRCWTCERISLHCDVTKEWVRCQACGSPDTRVMRRETDRLRMAAGLEPLFSRLCRSES